MDCHQQEPYFNPEIPFTGHIDGGLVVGKIITVTGRAKPTGNRFHVNLQCGSTEQRDIALHFNPRYDGQPGYVVCNTFHLSKWGREEKSSEASICRGSNFTLTFLVNKKSYTVIVNGSHFVEYLHRLPFKGVDTISVEGEVEVNSISFQNPVKFDCHVAPYEYNIKGGLCTGKGLTIQGVVKDNAHRFSFNFLCNSGVASHFNPRFDQNVVVRNTLLNKKWAQEERSGGLPFYPGQPFMVTIVCEEHFYKVIINGAQMFTYSHRFLDFQDINIHEIHGDVILCSVTETGKN